MGGYTGEFLPGEVEGSYGPIPRKLAPNMAQLREPTI